MLTRSCLLLRNVSRTPFISVTSVKNMWHPTAWPLWWKVRVMLTSRAGGDVSWRGVKLQSTRTYCSLHRNRAVISLLYCTGCFSTLLLFNALNLSEIYGSVGKVVLLNRRVSFAVMLTLTPYPLVLLSDVSCTAEPSFKLHISVVQKGQK